MEKPSLVPLQLIMEVELRTLGGLTIPIERSSTPLQNPYTDPSMMESESDKSLGQSTLQQTSLKRLNTNDAAIAQREREINDIAQGIIELADIFKELQGMVIDQGTMLDRIDYNIENMAVNVKAADKELNVVRSFAQYPLLFAALTGTSQATGYQRTYTKRKILFLLFLLVIGMFILLLVKPKRSRAPATSLPLEGGEPIGGLGVARPESDVAAVGPDVVQPNGGSPIEGLPP